MVKKRFCRFPVAAALVGTWLGVLIWLGSREPFSRRAFGMFRRALIDGWRERLGPLPGAIPKCDTAPPPVWRGNS